MGEKIEIQEEDILSKNITNDERRALLSAFFKFLGEVGEAANNIVVLGKGQSKYKGLIESSKEKISLTSLEFLSPFYDGYSLVLPTDREEKSIQPVAGMLRYITMKG